MKWVIIGAILIALLPFYIYVLNKSAWYGKLTAIKNFFKEEHNGKGKKEK